MPTGARYRHCLAAAVLGTFALAASLATYSRHAEGLAVLPQSVVVVGDSLTALNTSTVERSLKAHHVPSWKLNAHTGRRSTIDVTTASGVLESGLTAIGQLKAQGYTAPVWIIEQGTNDLGSLGACHCDQKALARSRIDTISRAIGPGAHIGWVTVHHGQHPIAAATWNAAVAEAAAASPDLFVVDWAARSAGHSNWFVDGIHPNALGAPALAELIASSVEGMLPRWITPTTTLAVTVREATDPVGTSFADTATAGQPAVRLQTPVQPVGGLTIADRCGSISGNVGPGSNPAAVRAVQCALREFGYDPGPVNGVYGAATATAMSHFTRHLGLRGSTVVFSGGHGLGIWNY
jgi:lysophospholipase L1-like esterase